jgi:hypothetical protein
MFLFVQETELDHEHEPPGTYTPSPSKLLGLAYPFPPEEEALIAAWISDWLQLLACRQVPVSP